MKKPNEHITIPHGPPITISASSLLGVTYSGGWTRVDTRTLVTPFPDNTVTDVVLTVAGGSPFKIGPFTDGLPRRWEIAFDFNPHGHVAGAYPDLKLGVQTDLEGRNARVVTRCDAYLDQNFFHNVTTYQSLNQAEITSLAVIVNGTPYPNCPDKASSIQVNFSLSLSALALAKLAQILGLPDPDE